MPFQQRFRYFPLKYRMSRTPLPADTFGDRFDLDKLPLPRRSAGYGVQMLNTDNLLDRDTGQFLPVRNPSLHGLFVSFKEAYSAAATWVETYSPINEEHNLAIVPVGFDEVLQRHVLIYGVLCGQP